MKEYISSLPLQGVNYVFNLESDINVGHFMQVIRLGATPYAMINSSAPNYKSQLRLLDAMGLKLSDLPVMAQRPARVVDVQVWGLIPALRNFRVLYPGMRSGNAGQWYYVDDNEQKNAIVRSIGFVTISPMQIVNADVMAFNRGNYVVMGTANPN